MQSETDFYHNTPPQPFNFDFAYPQSLVFPPFALLNDSRNLVN